MVIVIGQENIIVKAVVSTPEELDIKYGIAVGLSKDGCMGHRSERIMHSGCMGSYVLGLVRSSRFRHERYMRSARLRGYNRTQSGQGSGFSVTS